MFSKFQFVGAFHLLGEIPLDQSRFGFLQLIFPLFVLRRFVFV